MPPTGISGLDASDTARRHGGCDRTRRDRVRGDAARQGSPREDGGQRVDASFGDAVCGVARPLVIRGVEASERELIDKRLCDGAGSPVHAQSPKSTASEEAKVAKRAKTRIAASWSSAVAEAQQSSSTAQT